MRARGGEWRQPKDFRDHLWRKGERRENQPPADGSRDLRDESNARRAAYDQETSTSNVHPPIQAPEPHDVVDINKRFENLLREILRQVRHKGNEARLGHPGPIRYAITFYDEIMATPFPQNFKMTNLVIYDAKGDPKAHVNVFSMWMDFKEVFEIAQCKVLPLTLTGMAQA